MAPTVAMDATVGSRLKCVCVCVCVCVGSTWPTWCPWRWAATTAWSTARSAPSGSQSFASSWRNPSPCSCDWTVLWPPKRRDRPGPLLILLLNQIGAAIAEAKRGPPPPNNSWPVERTKLSLQFHLVSPPLFLSSVIHSRIYCGPPQVSYLTKIS